jgi:hypothetical protein
MHQPLNLITLRSYQLHTTDQEFNFGSLHHHVIELLAYLSHHQHSLLLSLQAALYPDLPVKQVQAWLEMVNDGLLRAASPVTLVFGPDTRVSLSQKLAWDVAAYLELSQTSGFQAVYQALAGYHDPLLPASESPWVVGLRERLRIHLLTIGEGVCANFQERVQMFVHLEQKVPAAGRWLAGGPGSRGLLPYQPFELFGLGG